jgi:hypothetical protein
VSHYVGDDCPTGHFENEDAVVLYPALMGARDEVASLRAAIDDLNRIKRAALSLVTRDDFWRNAGTLPGEYDNLRDALGLAPDAQPRVEP